MTPIDVGELERLGGLDHKMPWKSVFALIKDTEMRLHNSLLSVPLGCLWMQKWWSGRGRLLSTTKWPSLGRIQIYFTLQLSPFYTYLNLDMPCSDEFCPVAILPGGAIAPPTPPSPTSMDLITADYRFSEEGSVYHIAQPQAWLPLITVSQRRGPYTP